MPDSALLGRHALLNNAFSDPYFATSKSIKFSSPRAMVAELASSDGRPRSATVWRCRM